MSVADYLENLDNRISNLEGLHFESNPHLRDKEVFAKGYDLSWMCDIMKIEMEFTDQLQLLIKGLSEYQKELSNRFTLLEDYINTRTSTKKVKYK